MSQRPPLPPLPPLPQPFQAALGLAAEAAEQARRLPELAVELPVRVAGTLLQLSMRAQQRYSALVARGEAVLTARPVTDDPPPWATFDDDADTAEDGVRADTPGVATLPRPSRFDLVGNSDGDGTTISDGTTTSDGAAWDGDDRPVGSP